MGSVSIGLQIGVKRRKWSPGDEPEGDGFPAHLEFQAGWDASVALGPVGGGAKSDVSTDFLSFSKSQGLYAGVNLDGSYLSVRDSLNKAYYGKEVSPRISSSGNRSATGGRSVERRAEKGEIARTEGDGEDGGRSRTVGVGLALMTLIAITLPAYAGNRRRPTGGPSPYGRTCGPPASAGR